MKIKHKDSTEKRSFTFTFDTDGVGCTLGLEFIKKKTRGINKTNEQKEGERLHQLELEEEKIRNFKKRKRDKDPTKISSWQYIHEKSKNFIAESVNNK